MSQDKSQGYDAQTSLTIIVLLPLPVDPPDPDDPPPPPIARILNKISYCSSSSPEGAGRGKGGVETDILDDCITDWSVALPSLLCPNIFVLEYHFITWNVTHGCQSFIRKLPYSTSTCSEIAEGMPARWLHRLRVQDLWLSPSFDFSGLIKNYLV